MVPTVRVTFHTPLPAAIETSAYDINPLITSIQITSQLPGGWNTCLLGATSFADEHNYAPQLPKPEDIKPRGHVVVTVGELVIFEGAVMKRKRKGSVTTEVTARGYGIVGLNDDWYKNNEVNSSSTVSQIQATQKKAGEIIADAVNSCAPLIRLGSKNEFIEPGTIYIPGSFYGQTPAQIIEAITKVGNNLNLVWDMWVYEDRVLNLRPRKLSGVPDYEIPGDEFAEVVDDWQNIMGEARVEFQLPDWDNADKSVLVPDHNGNYQTTDQTNPRFQKRYGIIKRAYLKAGQLTAVTAEQFRDTNLVVHEDPDTSATITRTQWRGLELASGAEMPTYAARASQWIKIAEEDPLVIVQTDWKNDGSFTCEAGKFSQHWQSFMSYLSEISRHVVMGTNPLSGTRA